MRVTPAVRIKDGFVSGHERGWGLDGWGGRTAREKIVLIIASSIVLKVSFYKNNSVTVLTYISS